MKILLFLALIRLMIISVYLGWRSKAVRAGAFDIVLDFRKRRLTLPLVYLLYGVIAVPCFGLLMPPYQTSDEGAHFARADQVSLGVPLGYRSGKNSGGIIDRGITTSFDTFYSIVLHQERKSTLSLSQQAYQSKWEDGKEFSDFANTAFYPPYFYTASAFAINLGKLLDLSVVKTLYVARLLNGFIALGIGALAITVSGTAAPWFFAVLCLPMSLAQAASTSQDSMLFSISALSAAIAVRSLRERDENANDFALMCVLLALLATGRVTYGTLALLPLIMFEVSLRGRIIGAVSVGFASLGWSWLASHFTLVQYGLPGADATGQVHYLLSHPLKPFEIAANTMTYQSSLYLESFIGRLGWLDVILPSLYIVTAWCVLFVSALASIVTGDFHRKRMYVSTTVSVAVASSVIGLFGALYISWTPVGNFIVDGIQGRYFIPLAFFAPALCPFGARPAFGRWTKWLTSAVAIFPACSIAVATMRIVQRYYETY